jgi:enoyl-CoA hydratase/carnithine racemase
VAAVDGLAIGIGTTMLLHCDLVYVTASARLALPFVDLGLVPEAASSLLLPQRIGLAKASELLLLGAPLTGEEAVRVGLANGLETPESLLPAGLARAEALAAKPPIALMASRQLLRGDIERLLARIDAEAAVFGEALKGPECRRAIDAFLAKSKPGGRV